jgi:hypothetical protein
MGFWQRWQADRALRQRAMLFLRRIEQDPPEADVQWLAGHGTAGDLDHARWELRYARRALGLLAAERDALDDQTASAVARALSESIARDPNIAAEKRGVAERQFNARLRAYGEALAQRLAPEPTGARLGRALLAFAGRTEDLVVEDVARAGELLSGYLTEWNDALRKTFGAASLPEDLPPSAVADTKATR